jgi:hypothetical protein
LRGILCRVAGHNDQVLVGCVKLADSECRRTGACPARGGPFWRD